MQDAPTIRELLPEGYLLKLSKTTGNTDPSAISKLVRYEQTTSRHWPAVEALARETNPEGFAKWEAARAAMA